MEWKAAQRDAAAKVAAMTESEREGHVQEIYATSSGKLSAADKAKFFAIMFGGFSAVSGELRELQTLVR